MDSRSESERLNSFNEKKTEETVDTGRKVRVAIIGCGWIAEEHLRQYRNMPDVEIVAGSDIIPGKAKAFFAKAGLKNVRCYTDTVKMLEKEKPEAVSVCTYNRAHAECAIQALERGVHVLLEKPFTVTLDEAVSVCKAEKKSGKILSIGFQPRFDENMKMIKKIVESGELGKIYYVQTGGGRRHGIPTPFGTSFISDETAGIGALGDIGCYSLDMVLNALGYPKPLTVTGMVSDFFGKDPSYFTNDGKPAEYAKIFSVDDFAAAYVRLEGGITLDFRIAWAMHLDTSGDTVIMGTKGSLRVPSTECWNGSIGGPMTVYHNIGGQDVETKIPELNNGTGLWSDNFYRKLRSFIDAVKNGGTAPVPSSQIIINQAIIDGIVRSAKVGHEIKISIPKL